MAGDDVSPAGNHRLMHITRHCMSWRMRQRNKHLPLMLLGGENVFLHDRDAAFKAMFVAKSFESAL